MLIVLNLIEEFRHDKRTLRELQEELDKYNIDSSIEFGDNDEEVQIEIWKDNFYYYCIDKNYNIIRQF